jgi:hypothetical protein
MFIHLIAIRITGNLNYKQMNISYYDGNIKKSDCIGNVSMKRFVEANRNPSPTALTLLNAIHKAAMDGDKELKNKLKQRLHYFTPSVNIKKGDRRKYDNIKGFNGIVQLDFDEDENTDELKDYLWNNYRQLYCAYTSPSGKGIKALMRIPIVESVKEYKEYFLAIEEHFQNIGIDSFDHAPFNCILPLYLSHDPKIFYRRSPLIWHSWKELESEEHIHFDSNQVDVNFQDGDDTVYKSKAYYRKITVDIFNKKVDSIIASPGHGPWRDACLTLGSRVGAGYVDLFDAIAIANNALNRNTYLQKDLKGYRKTGMSRIEIGSSNPIYYN